MGSMSIVHWAAVLLVVILVFGTKKLGNIGADLGKVVRGFKDEVKGEGAIAQEDVLPPQQLSRAGRTEYSDVNQRDKAGIAAD